MVESSREAASKAAAAKAAAAKSKPATSTSTVAGVPISVVPKTGQSYTPVAKPTTPSTQSLNIYGSPGANTRPVNKTPIVETPTKKPVKTTPAPATPAPAMGAVGRGEYGPTTTGSTSTGTSGSQSRPSTRTPVYGANGKLLGYNVTNYNLDGSIASVDFEADLSGAEETVTGTTNIQVLKSMLISAGLSASLVEGSTTFLQTLLKEGLSEESAVDIYLNNKEFTTKTGTVLTSPFYSAYGFYNEKLTTKLAAKDLFNTVEGYKSTQTKYNLNDKFASQDYIQKYLSNNISVATLDENANKARLAAVGSDPLVISNLQQLGYIGTSADLTDFYLDPNVGMEKMQQNFNTAALSFEAVRRANTGITFNKANFEKLGAGLTALGYNEAQTQYKASEAYNVIGQELRPTVSVSNIYEGANAGTAGTIQSELEQQEFNRIESLRIKKLKELETRAFQAESGQYTGKTVSGSNYSSAGQI
jgi:hypothetical protein